MRELYHLKIMFLQILMGFVKRLGLPVGVYFNKLAKNASSEWMFWATNYIQKCRNIIKSDIDFINAWFVNLLFQKRKKWGVEYLFIIWGDLERKTLLFLVINKKILCNTNGFCDGFAGQYSGQK